MKLPNPGRLLRSIRLGWPPWLPPLRVPTVGDVVRAIRHNPGLKIVSLLLATFLWYSVNVLEQDAERVIQLPIAVRKLSPELIVTTPPMKPALVTLRGPRPILDGIDERTSRLQLGLADAVTGETRVELTAAMLVPELPARVKAVRMQPRFLKLRIERVAHRRLPVRVALAGTPALGYTVAESEVTPEMVDVTGPANRLDELKDVATETIDLRGLEQPVQQDVLLAWAGDFVTTVPDHVTVRIAIEQVRVSREFRGVPVQVRGREGASLRPATIDLTVQGPQHILHNFRVPDGAVTVDATALEAGVHQVAPIFALPPELQVSRRRPERIQVTVPADGGGPQ